MNASEIEVGMVVCEADGFMWEVTSTEKSPKFVTLGLSPIYKTALGEKPCKLRVKATSKLRVHTN